MSGPTSGDSLSVRTEAFQASGAGSEPAPRTSERKFCGWGNVEIKDKAGEKLKSEEIAESMKSYFERGAPIILAHSNKVVGRGDSWEMAKNAKGHQGIRLCGHVFDHYKVDDKAWDDIKAGKLAMLSIGGDITEKKKECKGKNCAVMLLGPEVHEFSLVPKGMNQESHIDFVNTMAKSDTGANEFTIPLMMEFEKAGPSCPPSCPKCGGSVHRESQRSRGGERSYFCRCDRCNWSKSLDEGDGLGDINPQRKSRAGCSLRSPEACGQCEFLEYCLNPYGGKKGEEKMDAEKGVPKCFDCPRCGTDMRLQGSVGDYSCKCPKCGYYHDFNWPMNSSKKEDTRKGPRDSSCDNCALRDNCREARFGQGHKCRAWMYAVEDSAKMEKAEADCIMALMIRHDDMDIDEAVRICDKEEGKAATKGTPPNQQVCLMCANFAGWPGKTCRVDGHYVNTSTGSCTLNPRQWRERMVKSSEELDVKVKEYIKGRAESGSGMPDAWAMVKSCSHCEQVVTEFVKAGKGTLSEAVQALAGSLDKEYKEVKRVTQEATKLEPAPTLSVEQMAKALQAVSMRLEALEKMLSAKQEPAPQAPAPCPPGQTPGPDGKCAPAEAAAPAPEQKSAEKVTDPLVGLDDRIEKAIAKALSAKGTTVSTPRPDIAKGDLKPSAHEDESGTFDLKAMAEARKNRRTVALV